MRVSNKLMADNILANLGRHTEQILRTERRIATGKVINKPSDDPAGMGRVLNYRKTLSQIDQYNLTIDKAKTRVDYSETVLAAVSDLVQQAKNIAAGTDKENSATMAQNISEIKDQILSLANSKLNGNYIFGGSQTQTAPFAADGTYNGDHAQKQYLIGDNIQMNLNADGSDIFQSVTDIFAELDSLQVDLSAQDEVAIASHVQPLGDAADQVDAVRAENASKYKRLEISSTHWDSFKISVQDMLSQTEDADMTAEVINLQIQQTAYETTLATSAQIIQPTLLQFLS
jgi:flagellar hook-associated protein 3 FlgL